jgi:hypothetical protein
MKLKHRPTAKRVSAASITAPESRPNPKTGKPDLLLSFIDTTGNQRHYITTKEIFLFSAGRNEPGEVPDGLDRLSHHKFTVHLDENDRAIGLDILPNRVYRSQVIPASQRDVNTVRLEWLLGGDVVRCTQRPAGVTGDNLAALVAAFDSMAKDGQEPVVSGKVGDLGTIISISGDTVEVRLKANKVGPSASATDPAELAAAAHED